MIPRSANVCVSIDGLKETNDQIRGIRGYFDLGLEGIRLLRNKKVAISVTMNRISAAELEKLAEVAHGVGAEVEVNILSRNLFFFKDADIDSMWPGQGGSGEDCEISARQSEEAVDTKWITSRSITRMKSPRSLACVLGYLQMFVLSNGDVLTGCYPLKPVGNVLRERLETILASQEYADQCAAMVRRECPGMHMRGGEFAGDEACGVERIDADWRNAGAIEKGRCRRFGIRKTTRRLRATSRYRCKKQQIPHPPGKDGGFGMTWLQVWTRDWHR